MKKPRLNTTLIVGFICFISTLLGCAVSYGQVSKKWETAALFTAPESVVFDTKRNCLYVGNFNDQGGFLKKADTLRNECISKLDLQGNIQELRWIDSLHCPTGISIFKDKLYIVERKGLVIANIETQKIEKRIPVNNAAFLNDIAVDKNGTVYISDTFKPCIHRIKNGESQVWYSDSLLNTSNGLLIDGNFLLVGNRGAANLLSISLKNKTAKPIASGLSDNIDGIRKYNKAYLLSWKSELFLLEEGNKKLLYELENNNDFLADFEFIEEKNLLIIPLLMTNKVIALQLDD